MFEIVETYRGKNVFNIYQYKLTPDTLDSTVASMLFERKNLSYIFTGKENENPNNYIAMLRRFIPEEFINKENYCLKNWDFCKKIIDKLIDSNNGFYSFYAEALMAYLNYALLDNKLICASININETLNDKRTGADACMYSNEYIVLGEAKFYKNFGDALNQIIFDFSNKSLLNKINNLFRNTINTEIVIKTIADDKSKNITYEEFVKHEIVLSGFILHNKHKSKPYNYSSIDSIPTINYLCNYKILFYHLPINSKNDLIHMIIKNALEVIVNESK